MEVCQMIKHALIVAAALLVAATVSRAQDALPDTIKLASHFVQANGCHDTSQSFTTEVPNIDRLDRSFHGELDGIEVVETAANNGHAYRNFRWGGNAISYELYARGAGHWVDPPKVFGTPIGGGICVGAAGGSEGIDVIGHYR
jgi:hypothetical protein